MINRINKRIYLLRNYLIRATPRRTGPPCRIARAAGTGVGRPGQFISVSTGNAAAAVIICANERAGSPLVSLRLSFYTPPEWPRQ